MRPHLRDASPLFWIVSLLKCTYTKPMTEQKTAAKEMFGVGYLSGSKHKNKELFKGAVGE